MFRENVEIHTAWTEFLAQSVLELFLLLAVLSLPWTFCVDPRNDTNRGTRCGSLRPCKLSGAARHSQRPLLPSLCSFGLERLDELLEISQLLISSIDFSKTHIYIFFSFCWIEDAENSSWFTSDWMDLAEWFNSSHAAGCRKILSHFTERMFLLSFLVITYLHELAQLGGSGGSCVAPSVCVSYQLILRPD